MHGTLHRHSQSTTGNANVVVLDVVRYPTDTLVGKHSDSPIRHLSGWELGLLPARLSLLRLESALHGIQLQAD